MRDAEAVELNAAVARAMGWTARPAEDGLWDMYRPDGTRYNNGPQRTEAECWEHGAPRYSTDPARLTEMLEWAREQYSLSLYATCPISSVLNCWAAQLTEGVYPPMPMKPEDGDALGYGASPNEALARAIVESSKQ